MKNCKIIALALSVLALASCADKAQFKGVLTGAPDRQIVVKELAVNVYNVLDTIRTSADGTFSYKLDVAEGQPEFVYLYYGDTRVAALLLEKGEKAEIVADTLGNYTVSGSEGSEKLLQVEKAYADFVRSMVSTEDPKALTQIYVKHYRESIKYLMENPFSMTIVPVLFEKVNNLPVFSQVSDALHFRRAADSLATVYPESAFVKALDAEATRRQNELQLNSMLNGAPERSFPDFSAPDINGNKIALSDVDAKAILFHVWDASDAAQKMFNNEILLPLYEDFHSKGLEIYSVCISGKAEWAGVVKAQNLPWINVNDGRGAASPVVILYNIDRTPTTLVIAKGELFTEPISGLDDLRAKLNVILR